MTERWVPDGMPAPMVDDHTLVWWQAAAEHRLVVHQCTACNHRNLPPAPICPQCRSATFEWRDISGQGTVYSYTVVHRAVAMDQELPFIIAVIELEGAGGVRMISNLVDIDPGVVTVGMKVEVAWEDMAPDLAVPRFRLAGEKAPVGDET